MSRKSSKNSHHCYINFKCISVIFQHSSLTYYKPLAKDQSSFMKFVA